MSTEPTASPGGERDLDRLVAGLDPLLHPGAYVFACAPGVPEGVEPLATIVEPEGLSIVCLHEQAEAAGLAYDFVAAWITLGVPSALDAVGLTAAVSAHLAAAGLACNVVAGRHHDHLFVPHGAGEWAVELLGGLARERAGRAAAN